MKANYEWKLKKNGCWKSFFDFYWCLLVEKIVISRPKSQCCHCATIVCVCVCLFFTLVLLFKKLCVARKRIPDWQPYWSSALLGPLLLSLVLRRQRLWESRAEHELVQGINLQSVQWDLVILKKKKGGAGWFTLGIMSFQTTIGLKLAVNLYSSWSPFQRRLYISRSTKYNRSKSIFAAVLRFSYYHCLGGQLYPVAPTGYQSQRASRAERQRAAWFSRESSSQWDVGRSRSVWLRRLMLCC